MSLRNNLANWDTGPVRTDSWCIPLPFLLNYNHMTNLKLPDLERFMTLLHATQKVKRVSRRPGETNSTNTAEHTFELVMLCWYIAGVEKLELNHEKILKDL